MVSIHAPNEGSDLRNRPRQSTTPVSIHAPNEGSDAAFLVPLLTHMFQSTLPMKGATIAAT